MGVEPFIAGAVAGIWVLLAVVVFKLDAIYTVLRKHKQYP